MSLKADLEYYLEREVDSDTIQDAEEWQMQNPGGDIAEWASAILEIDEEYGDE